MAFVEKYDLLSGRFLQHLSTKVLHLKLLLMMLATQFSSKMLKRLIEQGFCRKVFVTKVLDLKVRLMMFASQFSSKMLKHLKERGFCRKV